MLGASMSFSKDHYEIVRKALPEPLLGAAQEYFKILLHQGAFDEKKLGSITKSAYDRYCDALSTMIQEFLHPTMEKVTGLKLLTTYNYTRVYSPATELVPHTDRPCCEISATLTIDNVPDEIWPIYVRNLQEQTIAVELNPGDMLVYRGIELPHWREAGTVEQTGVFMHWVDSDGPFASEAGDPAHSQSPRNLGVLQERRRRKQMESTLPTFSFN
jgi:hypothetical protein